MLILTGNNLGKRHKELNVKVNEAAMNNVDFEQIKHETEQSDVDKLFKIDLASKYKNIEYIVEVLKSGDTLHISRALKCAWMFGDEFSHIFNVDYLHQNIFPFMSSKMKKKLLTTMSAYLKNVDRVMAFYNYCMEMKLKNIALNFIIFTSDVYKLEILSKNPDMIYELKKKNNFKHFMGSSFTLACGYLATIRWESYKLKAFKEISYLYSVSDVKYLDMLEDHVPTFNMVCEPRLGLRISKDIMTKHKNRVLKKPSLYINFLNKSCIVKYSTPENARIYVTGLLPHDVDYFWNQDFCRSYEYILNMIPADERYTFIKKIYTDKYPCQQFELRLEFYSLKYFRFMTLQQKDIWAQEQVASQKEILGTGNDYKWYRFINFNTAFVDIKKWIMITPGSDKRIEMINILNESAKTQRDLEKLFTYYNERHKNELQQVKENFMNLVSTTHNIFEFDNSCWDAFNKIYQNLDVYSMLEPNKSRDEFKVIAFIYNVINKVDIHDALKLFINDRLYLNTLKLFNYRLTEEKQEMVYQYLFQFYMGKINAFDSVPYDNDVKSKLRKYIRYVLDLLCRYGRSKDDIPEVVMKFVKLDWDNFNWHQLFDVPSHNEEEQIKETTQEDLINFLKTDSNLVIENLPLVKENIENSYRFHLGRLLKKLKVFFSNDISKKYFEFYNNMLTTGKVKPNVARAACYGIFQLGEYNSKADFMAKYAPTQSKFNRSEIDESLLNIQEAICATAFYSRPPVPLKNTLMYIKGDYVKSCLPMFNSYFANLAPTLCMEFIEAIVDNPLSIQKHAIRLAFACFNAENLSKLVTNVWIKTKNISLRLIIYKALYNKIVEEDHKTQTVLFETLRRLTLELYQDDDQEIFNLWRAGNLPKCFMSDYIEAYWTAIVALPKKYDNDERMINVVRYMYCNIKLIRQGFVHRIVEEFVKEVCRTEKTFKSSLERSCWYQSKWDLTAHYIIYVQNKENLETKLDLTKLIFEQCLTKINIVSENKYIVRSFMFNYLRQLLNLSFSQNIESYEYLNVIFETVLQMFHDALSVQDIYMIMWAIRFNVLARNALVEIDSKRSLFDDTVEKWAKVKGEVLNFGMNIGSLIKTLQDKNMYLRIFLPEILGEFFTSTKAMAPHIQGYSMNIDDLLVITSVALMTFKTSEMYMFALNILPSDYYRQYLDDYKSIINELKDLNDLEINCKMYHKFVNSDFKPRAILKL